MNRRIHFRTVLSSPQKIYQRSALASVLIGALTAPLAQGESELNRSRFLEAYQPHAEQLEKRYSDIFFEFITTFDAGANKQISQATGKFNRQNFLLKSKSYKLVQKDTGKILQEHENKEGATIDGRNALYSFALSPGNGGEYVLRDLTIYDATQETVFCFLTAPYANWEDKRTFLEIAQDPKTQIVSFVDRIRNDKPVRLLECKYSIIYPGTHKLCEVTRNFYFDPNNGWICCGLDTGADPDSPDYIEEIYLYEPEPGERLPKLKRTEKWLRNSQNPLASRLLSATDITKFQRSPKPFSDADFMLSAFGLSEPMGVEQPESSRIWIWLIAAMIGATLLAIFFAWLKRRHAKTTPAKRLFVCTRPID